MLSAQSAPVVRTTLPVVGASLTTITEVFYRRLFEERPELLRHLFNRTNQATGAQREALVSSVAAFATLLVERPDERPDAVLSRIAHKHVSLGITADQYPWSDATCSGRSPRCSATRSPPRSGLPGTRSTG